MIKCTSRLVSNSLLLVIDHRLWGGMFWLSRPRDTNLNCNLIRLYTDTRTNGTHLIRLERQDCNTRALCDSVVAIQLAIALVIVVGDFVIVTRHEHVLVLDFVPRVPGTITLALLVKVVVQLQALNDRITLCLVICSYYIDFCI